MNKFIEGVRNFVNEWTINIVILLFGTTTLVQAFIVPTPSMDTTVMVGDHLLVDKLTYSPAGPIGKHLLPFEDPKRGDIIFFRWPIDISQNYVKRVIGVPGDHIHLVNKDVYVNGRRLEEPYTQHIYPDIEAYRDNFPADPTGQIQIYDPARKMLSENVVNGEVVVPPESYFAMGDNRDDSLDSRYWGFVPRDYIVGKPLFIFWSYDAPTSEWLGTSAGDTASHFGSVALHFFTRTRWDRTLKLIRGYPIG